MMENKRVLLIEDETFLAKVIEDSLIQKGYKVTYAGDGRKGYNIAMSNSFDIIIIDIMLPQMDGLEVARQIRKVNLEVPILFLTAKTETSAIIAGYSSGGNDYLKKPFSLEELFLRISELLRRSKQETAHHLEEIPIGKYRFSYHKQQLAIDGNFVKLSSREADLLMLLYKNKNRLTDRKLTLISLWGDDSFFNTRTMDVFITKLRKHLAKDPQIEIINMRGVGYKLIC